MVEINFPHFLQKRSSKKCYKKFQFFRNFLYLLWKFHNFSFLLPKWNLENKIIIQHPNGKAEKGTTIFFHHFPLPLILDTKFKRFFKIQNNHIWFRKIEKTNSRCWIGLWEWYFNHPTPILLSKCFTKTILHFCDLIWYIHCAQSENLRKNQLCCQKKEVVLLLI